MNTESFDPALRRLIAVVLLGGIMGILDSTMVSAAAHRLVGEFGTTLSAAGWTSTAYLLALTVTVPVTGWAAGRFGARRPWLAGLVLFTAASLACALATGLGELVAFRVLQGVGAGILDPLVLVLLARGAGPARAGRVMGLMGVVLSFGPVLGPVVGGLVLDSLGWRWMFLINLPIGVLAFALALRIVPDDTPATSSGASSDASRPAVSGRPDLLGLALLGPGFAALLYGLSRIAANGGAAEAGIPFAAGAVLLGGYAVRALTARRTAPLVDLRMFARLPFSTSVGVLSVAGVVTFGSLFLLPLYYQQAHGHGTFAAGLLVAPIGLGSALAMPVAGRLSDRLGSRVLSGLGGLLATASALPLAWLGSGAASEAGAAVAGLVLGLALGFLTAPAMGALYRTLPPEQVAQGSTVLYMLNQLGGSLGIAAMAVIMQRSSGPVPGLHGGAWLLTAALAAAALAAAALLPGRPSPSPAPAGAASDQEAPQPI
ncbi:DHA2 family efflux MFS transporter permease subunit [Actinomadura rupiterrae]|uniref:DHA2 family efflux MFS transporter permease subunit n=1 Tax=Actinomadura rupiterrae TaxID=559627 RepID=UPI0020A313B5|nr:DHA2 family efflux MFS transporter permease subunit [Actinomadura rupiterrae]MCP2334982.1 EmrB/QacA subfamily drug resistance transporter [Actinomadura rupiterrae]